MSLILNTKKIALINNDGIVENVIVIRQDSDLNDWVKGTITQVKDVTDLQGVGRECYYSTTKDKFISKYSNYNIDPFPEGETGSIDLSSIVDVLDEFEYETFVNGSKVGNDINNITKSSLNLGLNNIQLITSKGIEFEFQVAKCKNVTTTLKKQVITDLKNLKSILNTDIGQLKNIYLQSKGIEYLLVLNQINESDLD